MGRKMAGRRGIVPILFLCLTLIAGCRTGPPDLAPPRSAERMVEPPRESRYDQSDSPREALDRTGESRTMADAPRSLLPTGGIGSQSNNRTGPYQF